MKFIARVDGNERVLHITRADGRYRIEIDGRVLSVDCRTFGDPNTYSMLIDQRSYLIEAAPVRPDNGEYFARVKGRHYEVEVLDELLLAVRNAEKVQEQTGVYTVRAPMPGLVVEVKVTPGGRVAAGDPVVVMEAMKMRNELTSLVAGTVKAVDASAGDKVESQTPLVVIERD